MAKDKVQVRRCEDCEGAVFRSKEKDDEGVERATFFCHGGPPAATTLNGRTTTSWPVVWGDGGDWCMAFQRRENVVQLKRHRHPDDNKGESIR